MSSLVRAELRPHALDGALLLFQPTTGLHVRWDAPETRDLRRTAPRVVMFGITNRCNLACSFCSRDRAAPSEWTAAEAFTLLSDLARRGTLEVAFGGGEPLAFPGFEALVERLATETRLAVHFTTNGALLDRARVLALAPHVGEIRVSLYDEAPWEDRLALLVEAGVTVGANLLLVPALVPRLPSLLDRLARLGCNDVSLLRYVGIDPRNHLSPEDERAVAAAVANSPARARLSVCFGDRLHPLPRLFEGVGGDCGAGLDFVTITSDRQIKACSFQPRGVPIRDADDVIAAWTRERDRLSAPARLPGCVRLHRADRASHPPADSLPPGALPDGLRVWRGFSGNNSGDCVLVGRFEDARDARRYIEDLVPGFYPAAPFSDAWRALLEDAGIPIEQGERSPDSIARVGPTVMLHTEMTLEDDYPSLRALLWKRGGRAVYSGIHEHAPVELVAGMRFGDAESLEAANIALAVEDLPSFDRRGLDLYGSVGLYGKNLPDLPKSHGVVDTRVQQLQAIASAHGAAFAAELAAVVKDTSFPRVLSARPKDTGRERLWGRFETEEQALTAAASLDGRAVVSGNYLLLEAGRLRPRYGYTVQRCGGTAEWLGSGPVEIHATFWRSGRDEPSFDLADITSALRVSLGSEHAISAERTHHNPSVTVVTGAPAPVLPALVDFARSRDVKVWISASPHERLAAVIGRLSADLGAAVRARRKGTGDGPV